MTTISDILHTAADQYLYDRFTIYRGKDAAENKASMACSAISFACDKFFDQQESDEVYTRIMIGLENMGMLNFESEFENVSPAQIQDYRYSWLKFAAEIAQEQGV